MPEIFTTFAVIRKRISMDHKIYFAENGIYSGMKLTLAEKSAHLYHYTSFDSFVKIWLSQQLLFSPLNKMNDIQEKSVRCASPSLDSAEMLMEYRKQREEYKQISFTMDFDSYFKGCMSPTMWGHYADKNNGVCIEIDPSVISFPADVLRGPVHYRKYLQHYMPIPSSLKTKDDMAKYIRRNARRIFFTKQSSWRDENEYRVVSLDQKSLDISGAIVAVYLTSFNSTECLLVEKLVDEKVPVKFLTYSAALDNCSIPVLKSTRKCREDNEIDTRPQEVIEAEARQKEQLAMDILRSVENLSFGDGKNK